MNNQPSSSSCLYVSWLSPSSRAIQLFLTEKQVEYRVEVEKTWEYRNNFLAINPACEVPALVYHDRQVLCGHGAIAQYVEEYVPSPSLLGTTAPARAEIRRLTDWFDQKFYREVTDKLVGEKIIKRLSGHGEPQATAIRAGLQNIHMHLEYIGWLAERRRWLAGDLISMADFMAASQLSCVDYLGDVPWEKHQAAHDWYARIKSRPSFRIILAERVPGYHPVAHYENLDF
ncbi:MAG: glutathione S-transferase family protein [Alphaproteobacteria bacterium]